MWARSEIGLLITGLAAILTSPQVNAQTMSKHSATKLSQDTLSAIGMPSPKMTPIQTDVIPSGLPVRVIYEGNKLRGNFTLNISVNKRNASGITPLSQPVSQSTLYLEHLDTQTNAVLTLPEKNDGLQITAALRDENQNLVLETPYPLPVVSNDLRILTLTSPSVLEATLNPPPEFTGVETISGKISLPSNSSIPMGSKVHVQLLENALAGGLSIQLAAQDVRPAIVQNGEIAFSLQRGVWERHNAPDLAFKAWISDPAGRKFFVMNKPVSYNGPEIEYRLRMDSLRQGKDTKRGRRLNPELMAQTLVQGEVQFDPVNGIPGQARLQIKLRQDRGDYNLNPVIAEQTLLLRGMETRIPFSLTTDSTNFDPYAPAPFLSVSLTDSLGRVYYDSGEIRAREDQNSIQLYPR
ncbi:MAG: hypothetical protein ABJN22_07175 [Litorimonas sp.]